jgi:hypothetical protein
LWSGRPAWGSDLGGGCSCGGGPANRQPPFEDRQALILSRQALLLLSEPLQEQRVFLRGRNRDRLLGRYGSATAKEGCEGTADTQPHVRTPV